MNRIFSMTIAAAAALATLPASAQDHDFYLGAAIGTKGTVNLPGPNGKEEALRRSQPFKLYGGYKFTDNVALEAGYTTFGQFKYSEGRKIDLSGWHVAAKGSMPINDSWSAFGKIGAVRHAIHVTGDTAPIREKTATTPLVSVGVDYRITPRLNLEVELASYGRVKADTGRLTYRQLQAGVNYAF